MPRHNVSYRPVRYLLRKINTNSSRPKGQPIVKTVSCKEEVNLKRNSDSPHSSGSRTYSQPHNNFIVLPQNSDALINVISNKREYSFKKIMKKIKGRKRKEKQRSKKIQNDPDVKPDISKIGLENMKETPQVNKHIIILSDSDSEGDEILFKTSHDNIDGCMRSSTVESSNKSRRIDEEDDDVIFLETQKDEIIEIDDSNEELIDPKSQSGNSKERSELLSTPESSTSNDFLENTTANPNPKFNFELHGAEFKDSEFLRPTVPVDISESGSISSVSDISGSLRTSVFNVVDFPNEKENLFDERNLEKFRNSITPVRNTTKTAISDSDNVCDSQNNSTNSDKNLSTLSDMDERRQQKKQRGPSIIRELVNDRAYVLLSTQKKKKKRENKENGSEDASENCEQLETVSEEPTKKRKRKKAKKTEEPVSEENNSMDYTEPNNFITSTPSKLDVVEGKKIKKRKNQSIEETCEIRDIESNEYKVAVRSDLYSDNETDSSIYSKKSKKKRKHDQQVETDDSKDKYAEKKKHKNSDNSIKDCLEIPDYRKKRKEKVANESAGQSDTMEVLKTGMDKSSKRRKTDNEANLEHEKAETRTAPNEQGSRENKKEKRKKKSSADQDFTGNSNNIKVPQNGEAVENISISGDLWVSENVVKIENELILKDEVEHLTQFENPNYLQPIVSNDREGTCFVQSSKENFGNEEVSETQGDRDKEVVKMEVLINSEVNEIIPDLNESLQQSKEQYDLESTLPAENLENVNISEDTIQLSKPESVWNMCSPRFYSSSQSLFTVVRVESLAHNASECIDNIHNVDQEEHESLGLSKELGHCSATEISEKNNLDSNNCSNLFKNKSTQPVQLSCMESSESISETQNISPGDVISAPDKGETNDQSLEERNENSKKTLKNSISFNDQGPVFCSKKLTLDENVTVKKEKIDDDIIHDSNSNNRAKMETSSTSSNLGKEGSSNSQLSEKLPDVLEEIVNDDNSISSMKKLCDYLEGVKEPGEILRKVSLIKQAFLAKSMKVDSNSVNNLPKRNIDFDDVLSISSSDASVHSIKDDVIVIEDDIEPSIQLANCTSSDFQENEEIEGPTEAVAAIGNHESCGTSIIDDKQDSNIDKNRIRKESDKEENSALKISQKSDITKGLDKFDVEDIQHNMRDDPKLWRILSDDLPQLIPPAKPKRCIKCREIGHLGYTCPNRNLPKCFLCGNEGHLDFKCPNKLCTKCGSKLPIMQNVCNHCKHFKALTCSLCKYKGHPRYVCPDLWRRYHLTVDNGPLVHGVRQKLKERNSLWCSWCGKRGHLEHVCRLALKNGNFQSFTPQIHNYIDIYCSEQSNPCASRNSLNLDRVPPCVDKSSTIRMLPVEALEYAEENVEGQTKTSLYNDQNDLSSVMHQPVNYINQPESALSKSSHVIDDLPPDFIIVDEVANTPHKMKLGFQLTSKKQERHERGVTSAVPIIKPHKLSDSLQNVENSTIGTPKQCESESSFNETQRKGFQENTNYTAADEVIRSHSSIECFFKVGKPAEIKLFISAELDLIQCLKFDLKQLLHELRAIEVDNEKPIHRMEISVEMKEQFYKTLNIILFGKEQIRNGKSYHRVLTKFVYEKNIRFLSDRRRSSLHYAYDFIFRGKKHKNLIYPEALKILIAKYDHVRD